LINGINDKTGITPNKKHDNMPSPHKSAPGLMAGAFFYALRAR